MKKEIKIWTADIIPTFYFAFVALYLPHDTTLCLQKLSLSNAALFV